MKRQIYQAVRHPRSMPEWYQHFLPVRARDAVPKDYFDHVSANLVGTDIAVGEYLERRRRADEGATRLRAEDLEQRYFSRAR
jgi:hypothetical protein